MLKRTVPVTPFFEKTEFSADFGVPEGTPKMVKIYGGFWVKGSWEPSGSHF